MMKKKYDLDLKDDQVVLFADILGFANMIYKNQDTSKQDGNNLICNIGSFFEEIENSEYFRKYGIKYNLISDSLFMSCHVSRINELLNLLVAIKRKFDEFGFHLRGGIGIGKNHHESNIWGPATIKATKLESEKAIYPRIIIEREDFLKLPLSGENKNAFKEDFDNLMYLDIFELMLLKNKCNCTYIKVYTEEVIYKYLESNDEKVKKKFKWLLDDIARVLDRNKTIVDEIITKQGDDIRIQESAISVDGIIELVRNTTVS
jgi:hypothetical protein